MKNVPLRRSDTFYRTRFLRSNVLRTRESSQSKLRKTRHFRGSQDQRYLWSLVTSYQLHLQFVSNDSGQCLSHRWKQILTYSSFVPVVIYEGTVRRPSQAEFFVISNSKTNFRPSTALVSVVESSYGNNPRRASVLRVEVFG